MVLVGRIARPHGLRGQVIVNPETDFVEERFKTGATFWTRSERGRGGPDSQLGASAERSPGDRVRGIRDRLRTSSGSRASISGSRKIRCSRSMRVPITCTSSWDAPSRRSPANPSARSGGLRAAPGPACLSVEGRRGEVLVPLAADICVEMDIAGRRIRINPPEGLLELNPERSPTVRVRHRHDLSADDRSGSWRGRGEPGRRARAAGRGGARPPRAARPIGTGAWTTCRTAADREW